MNCHKKQVIEIIWSFGFSESLLTLMKEFYKNESPEIYLVGGGNSLIYSTSDISKTEFNKFKNPIDDIL
jgi:hypothetical protein